MSRDARPEFVEEIGRWSDKELVDELSRRGVMPACRCGKWQTYVGSYDADGHTLRCHGCLRAIARCTCG